MCSDKCWKSNLNESGVRVSTRWDPHEPMPELGAQADHIINKKVSALSKCDMSSLHKSLTNGELLGTPYLRHSANDFDPLYS